MATQEVFVKHWIADVATQIHIIACCENPVVNDYETI
jgi:hypothetical protein